ncbi:hypothetical protein ACFQ0K_01220 [Nocardioides caeni]|uniref:Uncharacterized protein n=1 Tax=Nocardioides caeni TaxID=574700 RepID=A0A4S8NNL0_9ACTN|nr:hypothetical protein [Nocardioides caeni]THV18513.1 hypothetical protein E9934_02535 [Nocardioides caeni]
MTDGHSGPDGRDEVGSVGEEAMRLFGAFADLARQHSTDAAGTVGGAATHFAGLAQGINEHLATEGAECRYCPVCRVVHAVRQTSPDVKAHLMVAASSLLQAAAGMLETPAPSPAAGDPGHRGPEVQHIDLDDNPDDNLDDIESEEAP